MEKILKNIDISNIVGFMNREDSIVKNPEVRMPVTLSWKLRTNLKKLIELNDTLVQAQQTIASTYNDDEHSYSDDEGNRFVRDEFLEEYNDKMIELYEQDNAIEISTVTVDEFLSSDVELSIAETDALSFMIEE